MAQTYLSPNQAFFSLSGGPGTVTVTCDPDVDWYVLNAPSWVTILSGSPGHGNGTVSFWVQPNTLISQQSAVMDIAGLPFTVTQSGSYSVQEVTTLSKMTLNDLYKLAILETGQFITDEIEISFSDFQTIFINDIAPILGQYRPVRKVLSIYLNASPYIFPDNPPFTFAPDWVSDVGILMTIQPNTITAIIPQMFRQENRSRLWLYDKPFLWTFMFGELSVQGCFYPAVAAADENENFNILNMEYEAERFAVRLAKGFLLKAIGGARKAIYFTDWPISTDAAAIAAEGQDIIDKAIDELKRKQSWWLSV